MAENKESQVARQSLTDTFANIDSQSKSELFARVGAINQERDEYVNSQVIKLASIDYLKAHFPSFPEIAETESNRSKNNKIKKFIEKLSLEQKIDIIAEFTNEQQIFEGNQGPETKLTDIAQRKKENKLRYKEEALEIIAMYEKALNENRTKIQTLEKDIERTKADIASAEAKLQEIIGKDDEALAYAGRQSSKFNKDKAMEAMEKNIKSLRRKLASQETLLGELKGIQAEFEVEFNKRKSEVETELQSENIFLYDRKGNAEEPDKAEMDSKDDSTKTNTGTRTAKNGDREIAKTMMEDFFNLAPEDQRQLLDSMDNKGILDMARKLGPVNRNRFRVILNARLDELRDDDVEFDGKTITKAQLKDMKKMKPDELQAIRNELDEFNSTFTQKTPDEIEAFEAKLQYARIGALLAETDGMAFGVFKGAKRFFEGFFAQRNSIFELSKSFARYAEIKGKRIEEKNAWKDALRAAVGRKPLNELAKDGTRPLNRDTSDRSRF